MQQKSATWCTSELTIDSAPDFAGKVPYCVFNKEIYPQSNTHTHRNNQTFCQKRVTKALI